MKIIFISIALNIHQIGIADELWKLTKGDFRFIETKRIDENQNKGINEDFSNRPYLIKPAQGHPYADLALRLIEEADVMIYGAAPLQYLRKRIKTNKLTFIYSEHWLKQGWKNLLSPNLLKQMWLYHTQCHNRPLYLLSASAYATKDYNLLGAFKHKAFKWGYFTQCHYKDIEKTIKDKRNLSVNILWCGRFINWKHPEVMITLAERLRNYNIHFQINMIGTGKLFEKIQAIIKSKELDNYINLLGPIPNYKVVELMEKHHIACFTSDKNEGWGAVLNEAMSCGCCPVSSIETGSTPFLIKDGINGFSFSLKKENDLFDKVLWLIQHPKERERMSIEAYKTIYEIWSPENAAKNFYTLCKGLINGNNVTIENGPCSKA